MLVSDLVKEFLLDCEVRELSPLTVHNYEKQLVQFQSFLIGNFNVDELEALTAVHIKEYIAMLRRRGCKPSYINDMLKAVKVLCGYAHREGYTKELITQRVKNVKQPKVLIRTFSSEEIKKMITYYRGGDYLSVRNRLIIMILFDTGIRVAELMNLRDEHIYPDYFLIRGKGNKERVVPKTAAVSKWLMKYNAVKKNYFAARDAQDYLFLSKNGKKLTEESVCRLLKTAAKDIGVNPQIRVSPHTLRHTFAHQQLKNGLNLYSLSRILGHENVSITQRYLEGIEDNEILKSAKKTGVISNL